MCDEKTKSYKPITLDDDPFEGLFDGAPRWFILAILLVIGCVWAIILAAFTLFFGWTFILAAFWQQISFAMESVWIRGAAAVFFTALGFFLYWIKTILRFYYGIAEILIGVTVCWMGLGNPPANGLVASITIAGGIYIIVRGVDNAVQGKAEMRAATE